MTPEEEVLLAEVNAWVRQPKPVIPRAQWAETAERITRETILECFGKPRWYILRLLLYRCPFQIDEPEFKTIWYREQRRQLNLPEPELDPEDLETDPVERPSMEAPAEVVPVPPRPGLVARVRPHVEPADYEATCERILTAIVAADPDWRSYQGDIQREWNFKFRAAVPFAMDADDRPDNQTEEQRQEFMRLWYRSCAKHFGYQEPKTKYIRPAGPVVVAKVDPPRSRQKTLF